MNVLLLKRFLAHPLQVATVVPSSRALVGMVVGKIDFTEPRVIVEFGPGEGCHTREIARRMKPGSRLLLFELDAELSRYLVAQFANDARVQVFNADASYLPEALKAGGLSGCDYIVSGIPFSTMAVQRKLALMRAVFDALLPKPTSALIVYQITRELRAYGSAFPRAASEYCVRSVPPMFVTVFFRQWNGIRETPPRT